MGFFFATDHALDFGGGCMQWMLYAPQENYAKRRNNVERPPELLWVSHCIVRTGIKESLIGRIIYKI